MHTAPTWVDAVEHVGRRLADLAAHGTLTRGLRGVLAQHLLFLFNRHGISAHDQYVLAAAASRIVFGPASTTPDMTAAATTSGTDPAPLSAVTSADTDATARAGQLRAALADYIKSWGTFRTPQVEAAFRTVPRHLFLPGVDLDVAYGRQPVVTRRAAEGTFVSSASSPKLVATMLEQLAVQPGLRVLEIGAATNINAALLAELVGPTGTVVPIELDDDLAALRCRVRSGLIAASVPSTAAAMSASVPRYRSETIFGLPSTRAISRRYQYVFPLIFFGYRLATHERA